MDPGLKNFAPFYQRPIQTNQNKKKVYLRTKASIDPVLIMMISWKTICGADCKHDSRNAKPVNVSTLSTFSACLCGKHKKNVQSIILIRGVAKYRFKWCYAELYSMIWKLFYCSSYSDPSKSKYWYTALLHFLFLNKKLNY